MTFKDTSVLVNDEDEGGEHNLLENIELQSSFKQRMHQRRRQQAIDGGSNDEARKILPQYDDEEEAEQEERRRARITLVGNHATESAGRTKQEALDEIREKLSFRGKTKVSLETQRTVASDYFVAEESTSLNDVSQVAFKKPKKLAGKKRAAEDDILHVLESRVEEDMNSGLGTREQKLHQMENERQVIF